MCTNPKYAIGRLLHAMPGKFRDNKYSFCIAVGIDIRTYDNWNAIPQGSKSSISSDYLFKAAKFLNVDVTKLLTQPEATLVNNG